MDNLFLTSDSQIVLNSIPDRAKTQSQIISLITDIVTLTRKFRNIQFSYYNRTSYRLADVVAK